MRVTRFEDVNTFYARVEPYLLPREAEHNLSLGLLSNVRHDVARFPEAVFALVEDGGAVQLVALRTDSQHGVVLSRAELMEAVNALATDLYGGGMTLAGINGPVDESRAFVETWARLSGQSYRVNVPLRTFKLEKVNPVGGVPGHLRRADQRDRDVLVQWDMAFAHEAFPEREYRLEDAQGAVDDRLTSEVRGTYVWDDGGAVSFTAYGGPTPHGIRIGPVYTPPEHRQHGYASACVAGVSQLLLDSGRMFCFLFTDLRNPTSNHIYQEIGYAPVCDFTEYALSGQR